ncbi:RICIN domain-containing protein [Streptomyces sp. NPDC021080]|uniref:RICIN domain-containing protein n=1 Tax=Streptomyces sp. NPDC021080 TaxID=3365110 RepID=UPI0037A91986
MSLKSKFIKAAMVAAAVPALALAPTGSAYADGNGITWTQRATDHCLMWHNSGTGYWVSNDAICWNDGLKQGVLWDDVQGGLENQTGEYWAEKVHGTGTCLTAYWAPSGSNKGSVYLETCSGPVNYYEQWKEVSVGNGFQLVNRETGWCLDGNGNGDMYTMPCQSGNKYQIWY